MVRFAAAIVALATVAMADITYNVVGFPSSPTGRFGVSINGVVTPLITNENMVPVYNATVPGATTAMPYHYVELSSTGAVVSSEAFTRTFGANDTMDISTRNEFYQRQTTVWDMPRLPYTYLVTYPSKTKAFKDDQIATISLTAPVTEVQRMNTNPSEDLEVKVGFRFINAKTVYSQTNITFGLSGKSSKDHSKQAYKFKFETEFGQSFFSRPNIKLRSMVQDPTMMREALYIDMLNSCGIPTQQGGWVRLYVNGIAYGLYYMVDDIKPSFLKQTVHGGDPLIKTGSLVQMNSYINRGDLQLKGPTSASYDPDTYKFQNLGDNPPTDPLKQLIQLMTDLQAYNPATEADPIGFWNNTRLDLDGFLRNMALEYLMGAFDNYWKQGSNYFLYRNPALADGGKWQFIPTDFDGTFGSGFPESVLGSYKTFHNFAVSDQPLVSKLIINTPAINAQFETVLKEIVSYAFKPEALFPRITAIQNMLSDEARWDYSLTRQGPATALNNNFTFADFTANLDGPISRIGFGLRPWITERFNSVQQELKFTAVNGTADRVVPPPRTPEQEKEAEPGDGPAVVGGNGENGGGASAQVTMAATIVALVLCTLLIA